MRENAHHILSFFKRKSDLPIGRTRGEIVRGISIVLIMLHNLLHVFPGIVTENEFEYVAGRNILFFKRFHNVGESWLYDMLSFIGWYGVPVFIFLSGYGLAKRYDNIRESFCLRNYLTRNWKKLFFLILPGVIFFLAEEAGHCLATGRGVLFPTLMSMAIPLTCLNDLVQAWLPTVPGVYWYLGLAFELYIIYGIFAHRSNPMALWVLTIICYLVTAYAASQSCQSHDYALTAYLRHNFTGWMASFAFGIWYSRHTYHRLTVVILVVLASFLLFFPLLSNPWGWQIAAICAIIIIIALSIIIEKIPFLREMWGWIGRISPFIYVAHPIVRHLIGRYIPELSNGGTSPTPQLVTVYIGMSVICALIYREIWRRIRVF